MATIDQWHGYVPLVDIYMNDHSGRIFQECNVKVVRRGVDNRLDWQTSPFGGVKMANEKGEGWHREVVAVTEKQAPYIGMSACDRIFEALVHHKIAHCHEWSNFFYCLSQKRFGSKFVDLESRATSPYGVRFMNPEWQIVVGHGYPVTLSKRTASKVAKANLELAKIRNDFGEFLWEPDHFGLVPQTYPTEWRPVDL